MDIGIVLIIFAVMSLVMLFIFIRIQHQKHQAALKREEVKYQFQIINSTQEIMACADVIPFSIDLQLCLLNRICNAFKIICALDPSDNRSPVKAEYLKRQIEVVSQKEDDEEKMEYIVPDEDQQAINALKFVKRLKGIVQSEHNKGCFGSEELMREKTRLDSLQVKINIENLVKRADQQTLMGKTGSAKQLLKKGIDVLQTKSDDYSLERCVDLKNMLHELQSEQQRHSIDAIAKADSSIDERTREINQLFNGEKKSW